MMRSEKREHLIDVATRVFNQAGYHASGVDRVIADAGIAKTTLYRHFESKEGLIVAVLERLDEQFRADMRRAVDASAANPKKKLLATFDFIAAWFESDAFRGCPFMSAAGEYGDRSNAVFREVATHKRLVLAYFEELARAAQLRNPKQLAAQINLLHEGATAVAHIGNLQNPARQAKTIAKRLMTDSAT